jgi:hypothetical protein
LKNESHQARTCPNPDVAKNSFYFLIRFSKKFSLI